MKIINFFFILFFSSGLIYTCNTSDKDENSEDKQFTGSIKIDGSSTVYLITEAIAEEYRSKHPNVKVTIGVSGTGGGVKKLERKEIDICNASRLLKDEEIKILKMENVDYFQFSVALDGLSVIVNNQNNWVDYLSLDELKKIWQPSAQGKLIKWSQIRNGWPDEPLHLFGPGTASGTYDYFTEAIVGYSGDSRGDYTASEDDNVLVRGIKGDKFGLGFLGLAYYKENKDNLKLIGIDYGNGPVLPEVKSIKDGSYSLLSRPLYIYIAKESLKRREVLDFASFYLENAALVAEEVGYVPLSKAEYSKQLEKLIEISKK